MAWTFLGRPTIHLYQPDADAVSLVVDAHGVSRPMKCDRRGNWTLRLCRPLKELHGLDYHFAVERSNATFIVADPLARRTERREQQLTSRFSDISYPWKHRRFRAPRMRDVVIYEAHLPTLSRHQSAPVDDELHRGTYAGARSPAVLAHLQRLNVAVEFLPLHASDPLLGQDWGYFSTSFHAMRECYSHDERDVNREVMAVVDAMHGQGIPVMLDVVFNHGGELWAKAWGEDIVYRRHDNGDFCHGSGCGPTIRTEHPKVRESIVATLAHLVEDYHFDGFRFDLGALHDKDTMLAIDRGLPKRIYLVAEPWALGGAKWGKGDMSSVFAPTRWAVWNDEFREPARTFISGAGDYRNRDRLMRAITGSHVKDGGWAVRPQQSINYISCHDGRTLADLVGGDKRRVFLGVLLILTSQGIPMLGEGTELLYSKQGHENTYNRPDLNQIDWSNAFLHRDLVAAVGKLIAFRKRMPHFGYATHLRKRHRRNGRWDIDWIFPTGYPHDDNQNAIGFIIRPPRNPLVWSRRRGVLIVLLNGSWRGCSFHLPEGGWKLLVDGDRIEVDERGIRGVPHARGDYHVHAGTGVVLAPA